MQAFDLIKRYSENVCQQIRWKRARPMIAIELENHLCDQRDAYIASGDDENLATEKAIEQMGDAVYVGQELDKTHKPKPQWFMIVLTGILMLTGISLNYLLSISSLSNRNFNFLTYFIAFGIFIACYFIDFTILGRYALKIYFSILSLTVIGMSMGRNINGRLAWTLGSFSVSLSFLSLLFPLVFALLLYAMRKKGYRGIILCGIGYLPFAAILLFVPSMSGFVLYSIAAFSILLFAIWKGWFCVSKKQGLMLVLIPAFAIFFIITTLDLVPNVMDRLSIFINPYQERSGRGYIYCLIRDFLSESVFFGKGGIPQSAADLSYIPNISVDYPLVYFVHQFGFFILLGITILITVFIFLGIKRAIKQKSVLGSLVCLSIIATFTLQSFLYIIDNLGFGFVSPISLPFISYGNTALFINAALIGFMLSAFRTGDIHKDTAKTNPKIIPPHYAA